MTNGTRQMTMLELVIYEVIIKTSLPSNRRDFKWRTNHIMFLMYLFFLNIYGLVCFIKHRCFRERCFKQ